MSRCDMAFIEPMHRNKLNITYLQKCLDSISVSEKFSGHLQKYLNSVSVFQVSLSYYRVATLVELNEITFHIDSLSLIWFKCMILLCLFIMYPIILLGE